MDFNFFPSWIASLNNALMGRREQYIVGSHAIGVLLNPVVPNTLNMADYDGGIVEWMGELFCDTVLKII